MTYVQLALFLFIPFMSFMAVQCYSTLSDIYSCLVEIKRKLKE